jgi:hypothetical protein
MVHPVALPLSYPGLFATTTIRTADKSDSPQQSENNSEYA